MIQIEVKSLHRKLYEGIRRDSHYYFTRDSLLDSFSLAQDKEEYKSAVRNLLSFYKELSKQNLQLMRVGFIRLPISEVNPELIEKTRSRQRMARVELMLNEVLPTPSDTHEDTFLAFTYMVQSLKFENQPMVVSEQFALEYPLLALGSFTAEIWNNAYKTAPRSSIEKGAKGM